MPTTPHKSYCFFCFFEGSICVYIHSALFGNLFTLQIPSKHLAMSGTCQPVRHQRYQARPSPSARFYVVPCVLVSSPPSERQEICGKSLETYRDILCTATVATLWKNLIENSVGETKAISHAMLGPGTSPLIPQPGLLC